MSIFAGLDGPARIITTEPMESPVIPPPPDREAPAEPTREPTREPVKEPSPA